jgi:hypothetical protein
LGVSLQILPSAGAPSIVGGISTITSGRTRRSIWRRRASATGRALVPIRRACRRSSTATGDIVREAGKEGDIMFKTRRFRISQPFRCELLALRPSAVDGVFTLHFCWHQISTVDLGVRDEGACGLVDVARAMPTSSSAPKSAIEEDTLHPRPALDVYPCPRTLSPLTPDQANVSGGIMHRQFLRDRVLLRSRLCHASQWHRAIRRGRCASGI